MEIRTYVTITMFVFQTWYQPKTIYVKKLDSVALELFRIWKPAKFKMFFRLCNLKVTWIQNNYFKIKNKNHLLITSIRIRNLVFSIYLLARTITFVTKIQTTKRAKRQNHKNFKLLISNTNLSSTVTFDEDSELFITIYCCIRN